MSGEMSLWEYGAIIHNWNERQPKDGPQEYNGPIPTEEDFAEMAVRSAQTVAMASSGRDD